MSRSAYDLDVPRDTGWEQRAACRDVPYMWVLSYTDGRLSKANQKAIEICQTRCPVLGACERWAAGVDFDGMIVAGVPRLGTLRLHVPGRAR